MAKKKAPMAAESQVGIVPLGNKIVIGRQQAAEQSEGGILIPDVARQKVHRGVILALPASPTSEMSSLRIGLTVLFGPYAGNEIPGFGEDILILNVDDILAVVVQEAAVAA